MALKEKIQNAASKANLNLSETIALNKKYDLDLQYTPRKDVVEITTFVNKNSKNPEKFVKECLEEAKNYSAAIVEKTIVSSKGSFTNNVTNALKKLKEVL